MVAGTMASYYRGGRLLRSTCVYYSSQKNLRRRGVTMVQLKNTTNKINCRYLSTDSASSDSKTTSLPSSSSSPPSDIKLNPSTSVTKDTDPSPPALSDSLHSTDIAFKPTKGGWGYNRQYSGQWNNIFQKNSIRTSGSNVDKKEKEILDHELNERRRRKFDDIMEDVLNLPKDEQLHLIRTLQVLIGEER